MKLEEVWSELRRGKRLGNGHWDSGMYIVLQPGYPEGIPINKNTSDATGLPMGTVKRFRPYVMLHTLDDAFVPFVMTQSDMLSEYWFIIPDNPQGAAPTPNPAVIGYNFEDPQPAIRVNRCKNPNSEGDCNC
jgi:hypothetical protein